MTRTCAAVFVGVLLTIAAARAQSPSVRVRDPKWIAPPRPAAKTNPLADSAVVVAGGRKLFEYRCTPCHGPAADGTNRGPDLLSPGVQAQSDGALFWKISSGNTRGGMPGFSFLPGLERWQLVLYLRSLNRQGDEPR